MNNRLHSIDAARALFLLLGIPYHFATMSIFDLKLHSDEMLAAPAIGVFMSASHTVRMFGFFILSGFFSALIIQRRGKEAWLADRVVRLGIPLAASVLILRSVQTVVTAHYTGRSLHPIDFVPSGLGHLWFLVVLLMFVAVLYGVADRLRLDDRLVANALAGTARPGVALFALLGVWGLGRSAMDLVLDRVAPGLVAAGILSHFVLHAPAFAIGVAAQSTAVRAQLFSLAHRWHFAAAAGLLVLYICLDPLARPSLGMPASKTFAERFISNAIELPVAYLTSICIFRVLSVAITRQRATIDFFVAGAMSIYLFHTVWITIVTRWLAPVEVAPEIRWLLGSALVLALSSLTYLLVKQNAWTSAAFCGTRLPVRPRPARREPNGASEGEPLAGSASEHP